MHVHCTDLCVSGYLCNKAAWAAPSSHAAMHVRTCAYTHTHTRTHTHIPDLLTQCDELHQQQGKAALEKGYPADDESGQAARPNKVRCSFPTAASLYVIAMNVQPQTYLCL